MVPKGDMLKERSWSHMIWVMAFFIYLIMVVIIICQLEFPEYYSPHLLHKLRLFRAVIVVQLDHRKQSMFLSDELNFVFSTPGKFPLEHIYFCLLIMYIAHYN